MGFSHQLAAARFFARPWPRSSSQTIPSTLACYREKPATATETLSLTRRRALNPAMVATWIFGLWLAVTLNAFDAQANGYWLHAKLGLVILMQIAHAVMSKSRKAFLRDERPHSERFFRILNEVPAVLMIGLATAGHQAFSCNVYTMPSDLFPRAAVGSVLGIGGAAGAVGGMLMSLNVGFILHTTGSYKTIFWIAGSVYLCGAALALNGEQVE